MRVVILGLCLYWLGSDPALANKKSDKKSLEAWQQSAAAAYEGTMKKLAQWGNTWQTGCSFSTALDYMRLQWDQSQGLPPNVRAAVQGELRVASAELISTGLDRWRFQQGSMCWYDDYSWWGNASAKAFDPTYEQVFGKDNLDTFQNLALQIWKAVNGGDFEALADTIDKSCSDDVADLEARSSRRTGAPNVWPPSKKDAFYLATPGSHTWAKPLVDGGAWQYEMYVYGWPKAAECGAFQPANPLTPGVGLGPFQDTVVNGLYLAFASRLALAKKQTLAKDPQSSIFDGVFELQTLESRAVDEPAKAAKTEFGFIEKWSADEPPVTATFASPGGWGDYQLLWQYADYSDRVLVRERVGVYAPYSDEAPLPEVQNYDPVRSWAGDQGLVLGALVDYKNLEPNTFGLDDTVLAVLRGAADQMTFEGVVQSYYPPFYPNRKFFSSSGDDYSSGTGVFWRHLLRAFQHNDKVKQTILQSRVDPEDPQSPTYLDIVRASANAAQAQIEHLQQETPQVRVPWTRANSIDAWEDASLYQASGAKGVCNGKGPDAYGSLFNWFNPLATLTAAITMIEEAVKLEP